MNKIYKVIWSKVRNCYVAVSEIAKRNGKSCTSVNCGAKANRGHAGVALAIALSLSMTGGGVAWAEDVSDNTYDANHPYNSSTKTKEIVITADNVTFVLGSNGKIKTISSEKDGNSIIIQSGGEVVGNQSGNYAPINGFKAGVNNNTVTIYGTVSNSHVHGGYSETGTVTGNTVNIEGGTVNRTVLGGESSSGNVENNTVNISNDGTVNQASYGGKTVSGIARNNHLYIDGSNTVVSQGVAGGFIEGGNGSAIGNTVTIYNGAVYSGFVVGGFIRVQGVQTGDVKDNIVTIEGGTVSTVIGGYIENYAGSTGSATGNKVIIRGVKVSDVTGGSVNNGTGNAINNTIELNGATVTYSVRGGSVNSETGGDAITGNKLILSKEGNTITNGRVYNFESIQITKDVTWTDGGTVLTVSRPYYNDVNFANGNGTKPILDISGPDFFNTNDTLDYGRMALLASDKNDEFTTLSLKYKEGSTVKTATLDSTATTQKLKQVVKAGISTPEDDFTNGVKLTYNQKEHTVSIDSANNYKNVLYTIADNVTGVTFGSMSWGTGRTLENGHHFAFEGAAIDASNLEFAKLEEGALSWFNSPSIKTGTEMSLLANATGITAGNSITPPTTGKGTVPIQLPCAGMIIDATAKGTVSAGTDVVKYAVGEVKVGKLTLGETDWADTYGLSFGSWGWTLTSDAVIDATNMTYKKSYSTKKVNDEHAVVTLNTNEEVSINSILMPSSGKVTVPNTVTSGTTTFDATAYGDIIVEEKTVKTKITSVALDKVTLGTYEWGTSVDMPDSSWTASASTKIDDTNFAYTGNANTKLKQNDTAVILNATGLTTSSSVIRDTGASATKTVGMNFTDNGTGGSGFNFVGTAKGHVEAAADKVNYVVDSVTLNNINLAAWTGTAYNIASADNWVLSTDAQNNVDAVVNTTGFSLPTGMTLAKGEKKVIITADDSSYFENIKFTGNNIWNGNPDGSSLDTTAVNGVSVTGSQTQGGIKVDDTNKNQIIYEETKKRVTGITLGEAIFAKDNGSEIAGRTFDSSYDATGATITTEGLAFTNSSVMEAGDSMTILNASNAIKDGSNHALPVFTTQKTSFVVGFTDEVTDKGLTFKGTHTDTLSNDQTKMVYTVGNKVVSGDDAAALTGSITWNDSTPHYTNTKYTFDSTSKTNLSGLTFGTVTTDPYGKSMTLISGNMAGTVSNAPASFGVSLAKTNTTLEATAAGSAVIDSGDLKYTVNGVTIDKINVKQVTDTAEVLPTGWVLKKSGSTIAATVETGTGSTAMTTPSGLTPGETKVILTAGESLEGITINGDFKWQENGSSLPTTAENGVAITGTQTAGGVKVNEANTNQLVYEETKKSVTGITLGEVTFAKDGTARAFDNTYDATAATINGDNLKFTEASAASMETGDTMTILDASAAFKSGGAALVAFADKSYTVAFSETNTDQNVTIAGTHSDTLSQDTAMTKLTYTVGTKDVNTVTLGKVDFVKGSTLFDRSGAGYNYAGVAALGTDGFAVSYASPETVAAGDSMTLLQANATLKDMAEQLKQTSYSFAPVSGVTIDATVTGSLETKGGNVTYTATANQASKLTFTNVDWKDSGALLARPSNITFAGADVDTTKIHFKNVKELDANKKMTLVSDFGDSVGTITGTKYTVGAGLEGEGAASLSGSDLVFTTKTGTNDLAAQEQTHNTLMVMEAGMAVLAAGNEHVGQAMAELGNTQNAAVDGTVTAASLGGSKSRYKTGSHVDSNSWNVAVAVGSKRELTKGSLEWGVFGEYGKSNYTLHSDAGRGDGDSHYAGGGLMAKWTNKHDVYTEASVRLGRLNDTASNLLRDAAGNGYGYDVHANYFGAHVGIGKIIHYKGGKSLDVYGKYFYTKRDGVDFTSGGNNYSLDSVASSVLRVGARYGTTDKKWNWYGGLAYEYEFDGKSEGTVDGVGIRAASVKGGSVRGEIGLRMSATKTNPWQTDISIYGYGGKHRGFGGSVNVAYMF